MNTDFIVFTFQWMVGDACIMEVDARVTVVQPSTLAGTAMGLDIEIEGSRDGGGFGFVPCPQEIAGLVEQAAWDHHAEDLFAIDDALWHGRYGARVTSDDAFDHAVMRAERVDDDLARVA